MSETTVSDPTRLPSPLSLNTPHRHPLHVSGLSRRPEQAASDLVLSQSCGG